jgi:GNAT superfamily N-acetyltransferase
MDRRDEGAASAIPKLPGVLRFGSPDLAVRGTAGSTGCALHLAIFDMLKDVSDYLRCARADDQVRLLALWGLVVDESDSVAEVTWRDHAREWFLRYVDDGAHARFPVIDIAGELVATAIGTLESGVPNPYCRTGRAVRLTNVITLPTHRGQGYGAAVVRDVIEWARTSGADRVDLSTSTEGQHLYEGLGFTLASAPRMKLVL